MKKRITILLFLIPFWANAQIELSESYAFAPDKAKHLFVGSGISIMTYSLVYHKTKDEGLAFRAGWMSASFAGLGKEIIDMTQGKEMSLADLSYTIAGGLISSGLMYVGTKWRNNRKRKKINKKLYDYKSIMYDFDNECWDLDNEFINNEQPN